MDEKKAAAYYDDMLRRGSGAAKSKQGLGYGGTDTPSHPATEASRFVKGSNHEDSFSRYEKENRLATVRDKLKRKPVERDRGRSEKQSGDHPTRRNRSRSRSRSNDSGHRSKRKDSRRRRSSSSRSSSIDRSSSSSGKSSRRGHERSRRSRDRSRSPGYHFRRSRSSSPRRGSSDYDSKRHSRRSRRSRSRSKSRRSRSRSLSRSPNRKDLNGHRSRRSRSRSRDRSQRSGSRSRYRSQKRRSRSRDRSWKERSRSRSPASGRKAKSETLKRSINNSKGPDYSKVIPGYNDMTPAEKVKAKTKLQLSETVSKDTAKGIDNDWERFDFNKNAPLDDDAKLDYFGDGTGAADDTKFLNNTGSTLLSSVGQSRREAKIKEAHDNAIFGPSSGISNIFFYSQSNEEPSNEIEEPRIEIATDECKKEDSSPVNNLLSDQVLSQNQGSWRERALKLKQQRSASSLN